MEGEWGTPVSALLGSTKKDGEDGWCRSDAARKRPCSSRAEHMHFSGLYLRQLHSCELILLCSDLHTMTFKRVKHSLDRCSEPKSSAGYSNLEARQPCSFLFFWAQSLAEQILISSYTVANPKREHRELLGRTSCNLVVRAFLWMMDVESLSGRKVSYTLQIKGQEQQQHPLL